MKRFKISAVAILCLSLFALASAQGPAFAHADGTVGIAASVVQMEGNNVSVTGIMIMSDKWYQKVSLVNGYYVAQSKWALVGKDVLVCFLLSNGDYLPFGMGAAVNWGNCTEESNGKGGSNLRIPITR